MNKWNNKEQTALVLLNPGDQTAQQTSNIELDVLMIDWLALKQLEFCSLKTGELFYDKIYVTIIFPHRHVQSPSSHPSPIVTLSSLHNISFTPSTPSSSVSRVFNW